MILKKKENSSLSILIYIGAAAFYFLIAFLTPYAHDDWDWGTSFGMNNFLNAVQNSRYVGNFFAIVLTRSELLKTLVMGSVFFLIPYCLTLLAEKTAGKNLPLKRHTLFLICNCLVLSVNKTLWSQTYGWVSGFANYTISALLITLWINEILKAADRSRKLTKDSVFVIVTCFVCALCAQLFLEHMAIFCVFVAVALCIVYLKNYKKIPARIIAMLIASVIGFILMFGNSMYITLLQSGKAVNNYREIPALTGQGTSQLIFKTLTSLIHLSIRLYFLNIVLTVFVLTIFTFLLIKSHKKNKRISRLFIVSNLILTVSFILCYIYDQTCSEHMDLVYYFDFLVLFLYFSSILIQVVFLFDGTIRKQLLSLWICAPLIIAPLLATTEVGHRLFITPNIFITLFSLISLCCLSESLGRKSLKALNTASLAFLTVLMCFYCFVYINIGAHKYLRINTINEALQNNAKTICLTQYPFSEYLHYPGGGANYMDSFKEFYKIPEDVEVIFESD